MNCYICGKPEVSGYRVIQECQDCELPVCEYHAEHDYDVVGDPPRFVCCQWVCDPCIRPQAFIGPVTALAPIRYCMECKQPTTGSLGQAGYYWPNLCQICKDIADGVLRGRIETEAFLTRAIAKAF